MYAYMLFAGTIGIALDFVFGDPIRFPHVLRLASKLVKMLEALIAGTLGRSVLSGFLLWMLVIGSFLFPYWLLARLLLEINPWLKVLLDAVIVFQCLGYRNLVLHVRSVGQALRGNLPRARRALARIVGRGTESMDEGAVCQTAIESGAENLNATVIAPLFWYSILGPIGILTYRISNTLAVRVKGQPSGSELLGMVSGRVDDILSWLPARLTSLFILRFAEMPSVFALRAEARKRFGLNAGWPSAAMSRRLDVALGGAQDHQTQKFKMRPAARRPVADDIEKSVDVLREAYLKALAVAAIWLWLAGF